ncbi:MAG: hypothetical protein V8R46_08210 [Eubacterium ramulus]
MKDKSMVGAFTQASFRSSAAVMGLAFIQNIYGQSTMGSLMIIGAVPLYNIYSVLVLTFEGDYPENERDTGRSNRLVSTYTEEPDYHRHSPWSDRGIIT